MNLYKKNKGSLLIEALVATSIIATSVIASVGIFGTMANLAYRNTAKIQASFLADEGIEAIKTLRNASWDTNIDGLNIGQKYYLYWNNHSWNINATTTLIDGTFVRYFTLGNVWRDSNFNIVASTTGGATVDSDMRDISMKVEWVDGSSTSTKSIQTYLYNLFLN